MVLFDRWQKLQNTQGRLEVELSEKEKILQSQMAEITSLTEDNERLSEQLASGIERPKGKIDIENCNVTD